MYSLSVVVVTYNNENNIQQALESFVGKQTTTEVVVVYNKSEDDTEKAINAFFDKNETQGFKLIKNEVNVGLGEARNIGLNEASGKYIAFLDGDDFYFQGGLEFLEYTACFREEDLIVYDYKRFYPNGATVPNVRRKLLIEGRYDDPRKRKILFKNFNSAWNKLYKHDFLLERKLSFPEGFYEDIDWNVKCLCLAKSVYVNPFPVIAYRQRDGSILRSKNRGHFDAIKRHREVVSFLKNHPVCLRDYGSVVYDQSRSQVFHVAKTRDRLPRSSTALYIKNAKMMLKDFRGIVNGKKMCGIEKFSFFHTNAYINTLLYLISVIPVKKMKSKYGRLYRVLLKKLYSGFFVKFPLNEKRVMFSSYWGKKVDCNPWCIYKELSGHNDYDCIWAVRKGAVDKTKYPGVKFVHNDSLHYLWVLATSKYLINNVNLPNYYKKREGSIFVQTKHGTPLKYMGLDIRAVDPKHMNWTAFYKRCSNWDYVISSNQYSTEKWRHGFPYGYKVLEIGYPRNDIFYSKNAKLISEEVKEELNIPKNKKIVMYAPTFRSQAQKLNSNNENFDILSIKNSLGDDYILLVRGHYFENGQELGALDESGILDVSAYPDTNSLCLIADVLITDYSSIMFDYLNLDRPIILYCFDYEEYKSSRGLYMDIDKRSPGVWCESFECLESVLKEKSFYDEVYSVRRDEFKNYLGMFDSGDAAKALIKHIFS